MIHHKRSLEIGASPRAILRWLMGQTLLKLTAGRVLADNSGRLRQSCSRRRILRRGAFLMPDRIGPCSWTK